MPNNITLGRSGSQPKGSALIRRSSQASRETIKVSRLLGDSGRRLPSASLRNASKSTPNWMSSATIARGKQGGSGSACGRNRVRTRSAVTSISRIRDSTSSIPLYSWLMNTRDSEGDCDAPLESLRGIIKHTKSATAANWRLNLTLRSRIWSAGVVSDNPKLSRRASKSSETNTAESALVTG